MTIKQAEKLAECYQEKDQNYIIKVMVDQKEITEAEAGFLLLDLEQKKGKINVL